MRYVVVARDLGGLHAHTGRLPGDARSDGAQVRRRRRPAQPDRGGFSLFELLVVIVVIGIIAVIAIPSMSIARLDRVTFNDAGAVMQLFREARTRAIARGGAVLVTMHADSADRGTFSLYEAISNNAQGVGIARTPVSSCKSPTNWTPLASGQQNPNVLFVDGVNLNGTLEADAQISTQILLYASPSNNVGTAQTVTVDVCWTPLGRSYVATGDPAPHIFDGQQPTISPLEIAISRAGAATVRSVLLPPNGMARLFSHVTTAQL